MFEREKIQKRKSEKRKACQIQKWPCMRVLTFWRVHRNWVFQQQELSLEYEMEFDTPDSMEGSMYFEFEGMDQSGDVDLDGERIK